MTTKTQAPTQAHNATSSNPDDWQKAVAIMALAYQRHLGHTAVAARLYDDAQEAWLKARNKAMRAELSRDMKMLGARIEDALKQTHALADRLNEVAVELEKAGAPRFDTSALRPTVHFPRNGALHAAALQTLERLQNAVRDEAVRTKARNAARETGQALGDGGDDNDWVMLSWAAKVMDGPDTSTLRKALTKAGKPKRTSAKRNNADEYRVSDIEAVFKGKSRYIASLTRLQTAFQGIQDAEISRKYRGKNAE